MPRALALSLAVALAGCATVSPRVRQAYGELLVAPEQCRASAPALLAPDAMARDVETLERLFRRGYAGFELAGDEERWRRAFAELRASLPDTSMTPRAFRDRLLEHVAFVDDNHVGLWFFDPRRRWRATSGHRQAYVAAVRFTRNAEGRFADASGRIVSSCDGVEPAEILRPVVASSSQIEHAPIVLSRARRDAIECTYASGEIESYPLARLTIFDRRGPAFERIDAPFPWLRLRTLFPDRRTALTRFVESAEGLRDAPVIVLDLRHAGGGSDRFLLDWLRRLTRDPIRYWETDALVSETTLQGALTFWRCVRAFGGADAGGQAWLDARVGRAERELREAMSARGLFRQRTREALVLDGLAPRPYRGRLIVIVDRGCGSACETAVLLARQIPGALIVGENTEGAMKVGELRWYRLPESGVWISLGMRVHRDPEGRFEEGRGFLPDLWLDGSDTEARIRALAECLADRSCERSLP